MRWQDEATEVDVCGEDGHMLEGTKGQKSKGEICSGASDQSNSDLPLVGVVFFESGQKG